MRRCISLSLPFFRIETLYRKFRKFRAKKKENVMVNEKKEKNCRIKTEKRWKAGARDSSENRCGFSCIFLHPTKNTGSFILTDAFKNTQYRLHSWYHWSVESSTLPYAFLLVPHCIFTTVKLTACFSKSVLLLSACLTAVVCWVPL